MKQHDVLAPAEKAGSRDTIIGISVLGSIIVFVAVWLHIQGKQLNTPSPAPVSVAQPDARFLADAWQLPNEPLLGFVEIPAGSFVMGSNPKVDPMAFENERWSAELNQGSVDVPAFYIGRYEVTVAQFRSFVENSGYQATIANESADQPIANVSWADALAYARWLEAQLQDSAQTPEPLLNLLRAGWRITLPTEAQWEKAARGSDGRIYPWGSTASREYANFRNTGTTPVGSFPCAECAFKLADMSGNVWELTRSAYLSYPFAAKRMPNLQTDALFVMRGGSFDSAENTIRAAVRGGIDPGVRRPFIGFRVVLTRD